MPANVVWGAGFLGVLALVFVAPLFALPALVLLSLPTAGVFRLAALIAREQPTAFTDSLDAWRRYLSAALVTGALVGGAVLILTINLLVGLTSGNPVGWMLGTLAAWGLLAIGSVALAFWPLMMDPLREGQPLRGRLWLSGAVVFASPLRYGLLTLVLALIVVASTIAFAALVTVSIAFVALVLCRYVLPAADRLEGRRTTLIPILD